MENYDKPWDFGAPCRQSHLPGPGAWSTACAVDQSQAWTKEEGHLGRLQKLCDSKVHGHGPQHSKKLKVTLKASESPQSCWASFDIGFDHDQITDPCIGI